MARRGGQRTAEEGLLWRPEPETSGALDMHVMHRRRPGAPTVDYLLRALLCIAVKWRDRYKSDA